MTYYYAIFFASIILYPLLNLFHLEKYLGSKRRKDLLYLIIIFSTIALFVGFRREDVGFDTANYVSSFLSGGNRFGGTGTEVILHFIEKICGFISKKPTFYLVTVSSLTSLLYANYIYKNSSNIYLSTIIYIAMFILHPMNIMQQWLAIGFGLNFISTIRHKKVKQSILYLILAILTHTSAIILITYPIAYRLNQKKWFPLVFALLSIVVILFKNEIMSIIISILPYKHYVTDLRYGHGGVSVSKILFYILLLIMQLSILIFKKNKLATDDIIKKAYDYAVLYSITIIFYIISSTFTYLNREALFFGLTILDGIPFLIKYIKYKKILSTLTIIVMLVILWRGVVQDKSGASQYHTIFDETPIIR